MNEIFVAKTNRQEIIDAAKWDLDTFAMICLPDVYEFPFPPIFKAYWQILCEAALKGEGLDKIALGLPRGFGKTIVLKLLVAWLIVYSNRRFILIICNTFPLAVNFVTDVMDILRSENFIRLYGNYQSRAETERQDLQKFFFAGRPVTLAGLGNLGSLRGLNIKYVRPDVMLMDDMQSREEAQSTTESTKGLVWMLATLMKANNKKRCLYAFIGNMYPFEGSILKKLKHNPAWFSFITGAILADGESIWPELRSVDSILDELQDDMSMGHPEIFYSEVMNDEEAGARVGVDLSAINYSDHRHDAIESEAGWIIIDPSVGKKKSDDVAIGAFLLYDAVPIFWDLEVGKFNPLQCITTAMEMGMRLGLRAIVIESVAYQATLAFWFNYIAMQRGIKGFIPLEIYPVGGTKNARINAMLKQITAPDKKILVHPRVKSRLLHQAMHFDAMRNDNKDDILDLPTYAFQVIEKYKYQLMRVYEIPESSATAAFAEDLQPAF